MSVCRADAHLRMIGGLATPPRTGSRSTVLPDNTAHPPRSLSRSLVPTTAPNQKGTLIRAHRSGAADRTRITWPNSLSTPFARHESSQPGCPDARSEGQHQQPSKIVVATRSGRGIPIRRKPHVRREPACRRRALRMHREMPAERSTRCFYLARLQGY